MQRRQNWQKKTKLLQVQNSSWLSAIQHLSWASCWSLLSQYHKRLLWRQCVLQQLWRSTERKQQRKPSHVVNTADWGVEREAFCKGNISHDFFLFFTCIAYTVRILHWTFIFCFLTTEALVMLPLYQIIFSSVCMKNETSFVKSVTFHSHGCNVSQILFAKIWKQVFHTNSGVLLSMIKICFQVTYCQLT